MVFRRVRPSDHGQSGPDFYLLETEVTNAMFGRYLKATGNVKFDPRLLEILDFQEAWREKTGEFPGTTGDIPRGCRNRSLTWSGDTPPEHLAEHPVALTTVPEANAFCAWLSGRYRGAGTFRLPTGREWLLAAYGRDRARPWGGDWDPERVCHGKSETEPVRARLGGATPEGLLGVWGNVSELVRTPRDPEVQSQASGMGAIWMGGDFGDSADDFKPGQDYWGYWHWSIGRSQGIGFRVLLDLSGEPDLGQQPIPPEEGGIPIEPEKRPEGPLRTLYEAAYWGEVARVRELAAAGADVNAVDEHRDSPLIWAVRGGRAEVVRELVRLGGKLDARDVRSEGNSTWVGSRPLDEALYRRDVAMVRLLLALGASPEADAEGEVPLSIAVHTGHVELVDALLAAGAKVEAMGGFRKTTPLYEAMDSERFDIADRLRKAGATR